MSNIIYIGHSRYYILPYVLFIIPGIYIYLIMMMIVIMIIMNIKICLFSFIAEKQDLEEAVQELLVARYG
jgi:hypothetical protein